ncbi:MAG: hypothetical protein CML13_16360 [Puniceicoccaceae bacterium]|nr:hypothetical protein [Puniceicoccaceae bacterium]
MKQSKNKQKTTMKFREKLIITLLVAMSLAICLLCWQVIEMQNSISELYEIQLENNMVMHFFKMILEGMGTIDDAI